MDKVYYAHSLVYGISYNAQTYTITAEHEEHGVFLTATIESIYRTGEAPLPANAYRFRDAAYTAAGVLEARLYTEDATVMVTCASTLHGIRITAKDHTGAPVSLSLFGRIGTAEDAANDAFATTIGRRGNGLRSAIGPASSGIDNAILDRVRGIATVINDGKGNRPADLSLTFDFKQSAYTYRMTGELDATLRDGIMRDLYGIPYRPINKKNTFPTPPAGWMTWYAVKFDASEDVILENAAIMRKKLYDYGANVLWVDWEWQHRELIKEGPRGVDVFHPFTDRYPHGLAYLAKELDGMGLIPALWGGFTHEPGECQFIDEHPETVLFDGVRWYGRFIFDPSHPTWREEYLRPAVRHFSALGYRALKWDVLPSTLTACDENRAKMYNGGKIHTAMREAVEIVREELGEDFYMMSCDGSNDRSVLFAADLFDGARISGDVFSWENFYTTVQRLCHLYPLHNTVLYCDPDNVVIREEFNDAEQAQTRAALVSLLGLPITIGDDLRHLPEERVELYRRILPTVNAHPMDLRDYRIDEDTLTVNLAVCKEHSSWNTVGIFNLTAEERTVTLSLTEDLFLTDARYHVYDFRSQEYRGIIDASITVSLPAYGCSVLRLTPECGLPCVVGTSRHITCGVPDLLAISYEDGLLKGKSAVVANDAYTVTAATPAGKAKTYTITPEQTGEIDWQMEI